MLESFDFKVVVGGGRWWWGGRGGGGDELGFLSALKISGQSRKTVSIHTKPLFDYHINLDNPRLIQLIASVFISHQTGVLKNHF